MTDFPKQTQIVIIGGGVMGASAAYHLARRGCREVVLLERGPTFGGGATGKCAGGIRYQFSTEINIRLSQLSLPMLERFEAEIGQAIDLRWPGYLFLLTDEAQIEQFQRNVALQHRLGVPTEWLNGDEVRRWLPQLFAGDVLAATFYQQEGLADPHSVVNGYIGAARRLGVKAFTETAVSGITIEAGRVVGVQTTQGNITCEVVVNAAGPWAAQVSELAGAPLPVSPIRRQLLTTTPLPELQADFPVVIDLTEGIGFHREGDGLLTGMPNPHEPPGFAESVDEAWELYHLEAAIKRLPLLAKAGRLAHWAGLYEVTPDHHPIYGAVPEVNGYFVVAGFSGHGFMHGPISGLLMAEIILDGRATTLDVSTLDYRRFAENRLIREHNVL